MSVRRVSAALRFDLVRAWREPPALATSATMRFSVTFLFVFGGLLLAACVPFMPGSGASRPGLVAIGLVDVALGVICGVVGHRLPRWGFEILVVAAILGVTVTASGVPGAVNTVALTACFLPPMVASAMLLPVGSATALVVLALGCRAWVVGSAGASPADIVMVEGCAVGMIAMVAWLVRLADGIEHDPLTGLLNRRGLVRRLDEELVRLEREGGQFSLVALDIDFFRRVNDAAGRWRGDQLIIDCAGAWRAALADAAILGRYGGDEFVLLLPDTSLGRAADIADALRTAAPGPVTASAGVAAWQHGDSGSMLLTRADVALYDAKTAGRDRTVVYGDPGREASELEAAIANGEMKVLLQPLVQLPDGETMGFEALIRWERPGRGQVAPLDFVPQAERTGAIHSLGAWVLEECCRLTMTLPGPPRPVAANVSIHELRRAGYAQQVRACLERWQMFGSLLIVEVTESVFEEDDPQVVANLRELRALGCWVAIDDFGAGYSSLRRLEHLPIDIIKVDGALVCAIHEGRDAAILRAIVAMGRSLGVRVLAEHVEYAHQAAVLTDLGYDLAQGYFYGRPTPPVEAVQVGRARGDLEPGSLSGPLPSS